MWNWNDLFLESLAALNFWEWYVFGVNFLSLFISKNLNFQKSWKNGTANPYAPFLLLSIYPMLTFYHILVSLDKKKKKQDKDSLIRQKTFRQKLRYYTQTP